MGRASRALRCEAKLGERDAAPCLPRPPTPPYPLRVGDRCSGNQLFGPDKPMQLIIDLIIKVLSLHHHQ